MRVALISTCSIPVPPPAYGGIETFVATLAAGLVARGQNAARMTAQYESVYRAATALGRAKAPA